MIRAATCVESAPGSRGLYATGSDESCPYGECFSISALGAVLQRLLPEPAAGQALSAVGTEAEEQASVDAVPSAPSNGVEPAVGLADDDVPAQSPTTSSTLTEGRLAGAPSLPTAVGDAGESVERMLGALTVKRSADGGVRIEAPPHAAHALMSLFDGMARLLSAAAEPTAAVPTPTESLPQPVESSYPITASTGSQTGGL